MSKIAEQKAWDWAIQNNVDPWSLGQVFGVGFDDGAKDALFKVLRMAQSQVKTMRERFENTNVISVTYVIDLLHQQCDYLEKLSKDYL